MVEKEHRREINKMCRKQEKALKRSPKYQSSYRRTRQRDPNGIRSRTGKQPRYGCTHSRRHAAHNAHSSDAVEKTNVALKER
jgi:hypothetical protein